MGRIAHPWLIAVFFGLSIACAKGQSVRKASATGIFCLLAADRVERPFPDLASEPCWTNPNVQRVSLRSNWDKIEPSDGKFDWTFFDEGVRLAAQHHKKISMSITAGVTTPAWVYAAGAYRWDINRLRRTGGADPLSQPLPWDSVFQAKWSEFIRAFGARYDNVSELVYVVMGGPGRKAEGFFVNSPADIARLESMGGLSRWVQGSEKIVDHYASAFSKTPFILAMGPPIPGAAGQAALSQLIDYASQQYSGHFGVMSDGLRPAYALSSIGARTVRALSSRQPVGFQMLIPSKGGMLMSEGSLEDALNRGVALGAHFLEVYAADCRDPNQAAVLQRVGAKLSASY